MRRRDCPEEMDRPDADAAELARSLDDLQRINGWLGGWWSARRALERAISAGERENLLVLDVGTGAGDIARGVERRWRRQGVRVVALDRHPVTLKYARRHTAPNGRLTFVRGDALTLPFRTGSLDVALCSLTLHHFAETEAAQLLAEMDRVARRAVVVADLRRSGLAWVLIGLLTRIVWRSRIVRHDGPASVRRAYTPRELRALAERAGLCGALVFRQPLFRMALVYRKETGSAT